MDQEASAAPKLTLHFTGHVAEQHKLPVTTLTQVLNGLQRAIHLLAMEREGIGVRAKDRVSGRIEEKYVLLCEPLEPGSVTLRASIGDQQSDLFAPADIVAVAESFAEFAVAIARQSEQVASRIVPDKVRRARLTEALRSTIPKGGSGVEFELLSAERPLLCSAQMRTTLRDFAPTAESEQAPQTVTGRLVRIDFEEHRLTILYHPTSKDLECFYDEAIEEMLLERPRELIQVTGEVRLDDEGQPKKIVDVQEITELDLSRFHYEFLDCDGCRLRFSPALVVEPTLDESQQLICLVEPELGIDVCGYTRDEVALALVAEVGMLWRNYACEDDARLSPQARQLKQTLRRRAQPEGQANG